MPRRAIVRLREPGWACVAVARSTVGVQPTIGADRFLAGEGPLIDEHAILAPPVHALFEIGAAHEPLEHE